MQEFFIALKKSFEFKGRSRRREFWLFMLISFGLVILLITIETLLTLQISQNIGILSTTFAIAVAAPAASLTVRRLHDTGRSGWWSMLFLFPIMGWIVLISFMLLTSDLGSNEYGTSPKTWDAIYTPINY